MNTRLIIPMLCAGALAFACGPRSPSETTLALATARPEKAVAPVARTRHKESTGPKQEVRLATTLNVDVAPHEVRFALDVRNVGNKHAELDFASGQSYDFTVVDSTGHEVWRWANGRMFTQSVQNKQLGAGESMRVAEAWTPRAGHYTAIATLNSSNYPAERRADFIVK